MSVKKGEGCIFLKKGRYQEGGVKKGGLIHLSTLCNTQTASFLIEKCKQIRETVSIMGLLLIWIFLRAFTQLELLRPIFCENLATCRSESFKNVSFSHILLRTMKETTLEIFFKKLSILTGLSRHKVSTFLQEKV